jgi:hypothetical protein
MDLDNVEKPTAKPGWMSRILGMVENLIQPTHERTEPMPPPPEVPPAQMDDKVQLEGDGFGKLLGRIYEIRFRSSLSPQQLIHLVEQNMAALGPEELVEFEKSKGVPWKLNLGDEYDITLLGPWNGQVRTIEVCDDAFSFVTLNGHPEAGRIRFQAKALSEGVLEFVIMSWARSRDVVVDLSYDKLGVAKNMQGTTWRTFLERVVELAQGEKLEDPVVSECVLEDSA